MTLPISFFLSSLLIFCTVSAGTIPSKQIRPSNTETLRSLVSFSNQPKNRGIACTTCSMIVETVQLLLKQKKTDDEIFAFVTAACKSLNVEQPHVCDNIVKAFGDELVFVLERALFTPQEFCGAFIKDCGHSENPLTDMWNITIPDKKPPVKPWPQVTSPQKTLRVLHLADLHIDRKYVEGSEADCQKDTPLGTYALCCRDYPDTQRGKKQRKSSVSAGHWGSPNARCDIPYRTLVNAMEHISTTDKFDYILVTGDMESHDMWDYSREGTTSNLDNITAVLNQYFPNTPIYQATGNHEGVPMDAMPPHSMESYDTRGPQWLYSNFAKNWAKWLPKAVVPDIQYRASYAFRPFDGLKLISLNNVYCSEFNFYLYLNQVDPDGTLEWLIEQLVESEEKGEKVHIIGHIPPGDSYCLKGWSWNFYKIINRFESTVVAQFYAHTHTDSFEVYYEDGNPLSRPTAFSFISPSLTTYSFSNPAYRVYTIDGEYSGSSFTVLDSETYFTNLTTANINGHAPQWELEYSAKKDYSMADLSPSSWNQLINRMEKDNTLFSKYNIFYKRNDHDTSCARELSCIHKQLCEMRSARTHDSDNLCQGLNI